MAKIAVMIPSVSDRNRGDQALMWQGVQLLRASCDVVYAMVDGADELSSGSQVRLDGVVRSVVSHPARARLYGEREVHRTAWRTIRMIVVALFDLLKAGFTLLTCRRCTRLARIFGSQTFHTISTMKSASLVAVKGGGFLHEQGGWTRYYYMWYQLFHIILAQRLRVPVVVLPNSVGPFKSRMLGTVTANVLRGCAAVSVRESASQNVLTQFGVQSEVYPDLAYFMADPTPQERADLAAQLRTQGIREPGRCVAITVRPHRFSDMPRRSELWSRYCTAIAALIAHLQATGHFPVFVAHVTGPGAHEDDRIAIAHLQRLAPYTIPVVDIDGDCRALLALYSHFFAVVGTRFHSVIFGHLSNIPSLAISYSGNKSRGIMSDLGLDDYVIDAHLLTADDLIRTWTLLLQQREEVTRRISLSVAAARRAEVSLKRLIRESA